MTTIENSGVKISKSYQKDNASQYDKLFNIILDNCKNTNSSNSEDETEYGLCETKPNHILNIEKIMSFQSESEESDGNYFEINNLNLYANNSSQIPEYISHIDSVHINVNNIEDLTKNFDRILCNINNTTMKTWIFTLTESIHNQNIDFTLQKVSDVDLILSCSINQNQIKTYLNELNDRLSKKGWIIGNSDQSNNYSIKAIKKENNT
ncbi:MAG: hypothetical protein ABW104_04165 [Candidatus Thiodiazotropha sp. 6PLUC2]